MVPFSFPQPLLKSWVMGKIFFDDRSMEAGSLALEIGCPFLSSCFPHFNLGPGFLASLCASVANPPSFPWFKTSILKGFKVI